MKQLNIVQLNSIALPLVQKLYKQHYKAGKAKSNELIYVAYNDNELCGVVRLRPVEQYRLLTGMLVIPQYRHLGVAHHLMKHCARHTLKKSDYCFAYTHLVPFYNRHHFEIVEPSDLPSQLFSLFQRYSQSGKALTAMQYSENLTS